MSWVLSFSMEGEASLLQVPFGVTLHGAVLRCELWCLARGWYVLVPCSIVSLREKNVQVVRIYLWSKWLCVGGYFMCDVQWYLHVGAYYPYTIVLQFAPWYMCRDASAHYGC
jgi:hypothetical protein